jgi:hypothetical protein
MFERFANVKVIITDYDFLQAVPLDKVNKYISDRKWTVEHTVKRGERVVGHIYVLWQDVDRIMLPISDTFLDYGNRLSDALKVLEKIEQKNQLTIVEEIFQINLEKE